MAKSHAQRQKEYRERKKAEKGSKWLENESKRTKKYYTKIGQLDELAAKKQRRKFRIRQIQYREKKRAEAEARNERIEVYPSTSTEVQCSDVSSSDTRLVVKIIPRKRKRSSEKKLKNKIEYLERVKRTVEKRNQSLRKKLSRLKKNDNSLRTPRSKSKREMREAGIDPNPTIKKKLLFANCISYQMKQKSRCDDRSGRRLIKRMIAGNILRKYKMVDFAEKLIGVKIRNKKAGTSRSEKYGNKESIKKVREFLTREDNARQMPGKNDAAKNDNKEKVQKFVLGDYLRNLYLKFKAENDSLKISFATFCRARPKYVTLVNYAARVTCLCTKHQNFALKLRSLKKFGVTSNTSPDSFAQSINKDDLKDKMKMVISDQAVKFKEWKRVKCDDGQQRTKLIEIEKDTFAEDVANEFDEFMNHAERVKIQFQSFKYMKESLKRNKGHVCVQMDFAENYSVKQMEEIQSAYWNPDSVTLHPVVIYYSENETVVHSSMVVVSDVLNHNSTMVTAILNKVTKVVKETCPNASFIHYWTDSPTSQYRNKTMFDIVARYEKLYGLKASWQFFEAGHGKGACDGIGGVVKRSADTAIKTEKVSITCGKDFYEWGSKTDSKIRYEFVEKSEYDEASKQVEERQKQIKPVKGTLKLHSVASISELEIMVRDTTCVCENCFTEKGFMWSDTNNCGWRKHNFLITNASEKSNNMTLAATESESSMGENEKGKVDCLDSVPMEEEYELGDYIAVEYENEVYIGKIIAIDEEAEDSIKAAFMENGSKIKECLKWPTREDVMELTHEEILCKVHEPVKSGKSGRLYKISDEDRDKIALIVKGQ